MVAPPAAAFSLSDVAGYRNRGSTHLRGQAETLFPGQPTSRRVHLNGEINCLLPNVQIRVVHIRFGCESERHGTRPSCGGAKFTSANHGPRATNHENVILHPISVEPE